MSYNSIKAVTMIAGEDLRGDVYELLTVEADGGVAKVIKTTAVTDVAVGILAEEPRTDISTDGEEVSVVMLGTGGVSMVKAGGAITAGQLLTADTDAGRVVGVASIDAIAANAMVIGVALVTAADGDIFPFLVQPMTSAASS